MPEPSGNVACRWCGHDHGTQCPIIKAIEFHEDGETIRRVEFLTAADLPYSLPVQNKPSAEVEVADYPRLGIEEK